MLHNTEGSIARLLTKYAWRMLFPQIGLFSWLTQTENYPYPSNPRSNISFHEFHPDAKINFNSMFYLNNTLWKCSITIFTFLYIEKIKESYWIMHKNIKVFLRHWGQFTLKKWGRLYYLSCLGWGLLGTTRISTLNGIFQSFFCLKSWEGKGCHKKSNKERRPKPI